MNKIDAQSWKADMPDFREVAKADCECPLYKLEENDT